MNEKIKNIKGLINKGDDDKIKNIKNLVNKGASKENIVYVLQTYTPFIHVYPAFKHHLIVVWSGRVFMIY